MTFLRGVSDRFWSYVSPRKTQQQRQEKPYSFKIPAIPAHRNALLRKQSVALETTELSPESRVQTWTPRTPSPQGDDIDATLLPPSPPTSSPQLFDDLEGDTLLPASPISNDLDQAGSSEDEWNANEDTMVVDDGTYMELSKKVNIDAERRRRDQQGRELKDAGWSEDAVFLFQKLGMRGFEPILPIDWVDDFETLPEDLFTANLDKAFIKPSGGSDYHAQRALSNLFDLGGRARDAWYTRARRSPADHIARAVTKYASWAMKDGNVDEAWAKLPLFETVTFSKNVSPSVGEREMLHKLGHLHQQWHEALQIDAVEQQGVSVGPEVPTLYGVTASHTVMAFASYAPPTEENETAQLRLIAMFDFGKEGYDVWNSLAVAIFIIHCRNRMVQLKECLPEPDFSTDEDPDL